MRRRFFNAADNFVGDVIISGDYIQLYTTNIGNCFFIYK